MSGRPRSHGAAWAALVAEAETAKEAAVARVPALAVASIAAIGWATVDLDRAATEFDRVLGEAGSWAPRERDSLIGAAARVRRPAVEGGPELLLLEPDTEGSLAAQLARHDEGLAVIYLATPPGTDIERAGPTGIGPLGPARRLLDGPTAGPEIVLVGTVTPMLRVGSIVIRVDDIERQAAFWQAALGYVRRPGGDADFVLLRPADGVGPNISLDKHHSNGALPPRIHLDLYTEDQAGEVARLIGLGATEVHWDKRPADADYVILADPEGNRFCVVDITL